MEDTRIPKKVVKISRVKLGHFFSRVPSLLFGLIICEEKNRVEMSSPGPGPIPLRVRGVKGFCCPWFLEDSYQPPTKERVR